MDFTKYKKSSELKKEITNLWKDIEIQIKKVNHLGKEDVKKGFDLYFLDYLKKYYLFFNGRVSRYQYWMFILYAMVIGFVLGLIPMISSVYFLFMLIPFFGISFRRLHDINLSGWWIFPCLFTGVGMIILCLPDDEKENIYG